MVIGFGFVCTFVTVALLSLLVRGTNSGGLVGVKSKLNSGFVVRVAVTRVCCGRYIVNSKRGTGINGGTTYSAGALTIYKAIVARHKCQAKLLCLRLPFARTVFVCYKRVIYFPILERGFIATTWWQTMFTDTASLDTLVVVVWILARRCERVPRW